MSPLLDQFIEVVRRSRLVEPTLLEQRVATFQKSGGGSAERLASRLVDAGDLTDWQAGKLLQGKHRGFFLKNYKLLKLLGKGGMSSVYLAEHQGLRSRCAIKVLPPKLVHDQGFLQRFHREARAGALLDHPHIVRTLDVDHVLDGQHELHFLVMEYVQGRNLYDLVVSSGPLPPRTAADHMRQAALGLDVAHQAGIVHRDVKPGNFLVDKLGTVKLTDLGLARVEQPGHEHSLTIQYDQKVLGTADYLAPEQAVNSNRVDARADLYSLGGTFYFLLTGQPPFSEGTLTQRLIAHQTQPAPDVSQLRPDVPPELSRIVQRLLAKRPDDRPQTAAEVAQLLADWLEHGADGPSIAAPPAAVVPNPQPVANGIQITGPAEQSPSQHAPTTEPGAIALEEFLQFLKSRPPETHSRQRGQSTKRSSPQARPQPSSAVLDEDSAVKHNLDEPLARVPVSLPSPPGRWTAVGSFFLWTLAVVGTAVGAALLQNLWNGTR